MHHQCKPTPSFRPSTFYNQTAKKVNCAFATVILHSLVIRHRNHPSCKINFPLKTRSMKGYKWTLILTSLALRIESSFCLAHFSIFPPLSSLSIHHRRGSVNITKCDKESKLYCRKVLSFVYQPWAEALTQFFVYFLFFSWGGCKLNAIFYSGLSTYIYIYIYR